ncbi:MAG: hypothetical protein KJ747_00185, partial [Actinobacteria bacterium]|nr:hypothetical protein [Actinomycetota bacterium]MCG2808365.1 hypothetical protein [Coriobacteriia bacterium]
QRVVAGVKKPMRSGYVKHYGKAISIAEWEVTCDYYIENFPEPYRSKWSARKGCAIHTESDFARPLMSWEDAKSKGVMLHYAGSPVELPQEFANAMRAVAPQHYVCKRCGTVLRFFQVPFGRVAMVCPRGCR